MDLLDTVRKILKDHPQLGYTSLAEYVKEALRAKFRVDAAVALVLENKYGKGAPRLSDLKGKDAGAVYAEAIELIGSAATLSETGSSGTRSRRKPRRRDSETLKPVK